MDIYKSLARLLDSLPNGFPATPDGREIRLLQRVFSQEEAALFCELGEGARDAESMALGTGRPVEEMEARLAAMREKGLVGSFLENGRPVYHVLPWVVGIYENQLPRLDRELARLWEDYRRACAGELLTRSPALMASIPVEQSLEVVHEPLPWERLSASLETGGSFAVADCICRTKERLLGRGCDSPLEVCLSIHPSPDAPQEHLRGRKISREEAWRVVSEAQKAGLVSMTANVRNGHYFICHCCGCCCDILTAVRQWGMHAAVRSSFTAVLDEGLCSGCGECEGVCQVDALKMEEGGVRLFSQRCIGCGLCVVSCSAGALGLARKPRQDPDGPSEDPQGWLRDRARSRGMDFSG
ncbi:MAG: 4Fe-4S binding protein [Deltaproteobacteria bacterium]|nr:4Fe-4S binding protein [Deltaproteobacteria bacterium]